MALRLARALLGDAPRWAAGAAGAAPERAALLCLAGKWLAQSRCAPGRHAPRRRPPRQLDEAITGNIWSCT